MKKLLGLSALAAVLVLTACGGSDDTATCTISEDGFSATATATADGDYVTSIEAEIRFYVGDMDEDLREGFAEAWEGELDGDYVVIEEIEDDFEEGDLTLEDFIAEAEEDGATCS